MKNFVSAGHNIDFTVPAGGVVSGGGIVVGSLFGVASVTAAEGETAVMVTTGVFDLAKNAAAVFAAGGLVSWDAANSRCDAPGAGFYPIGVAIEAAAGGTTVVRVRLDGVGTAVAA